MVHFASPAVSGMYICLVKANGETHNKLLSLGGVSRSSVSNFSYK